MRLKRTDALRTAANWPAFATALAAATPDGDWVEVDLPAMPVQPTVLRVRRSAAAVLLQCARRAQAASGLGDLIAIVAEPIAERLRINGCSCAARRARLNTLWPMPTLIRFALAWFALVCAAALTLLLR